MAGNIIATIPILHTKRKKTSPKTENEPATMIPSTPDIVASRPPVLINGIK